MLISPEEQLISIRLRKPRGREPYKLMSSEMINQLLNYGRHTHLFSNRKIGDVMSRLGYTREHKKSGYYYRVVERPFDQQQIFIAEDNGGHSFELEDPQEPDSQ